jgi:transposase
MTQPSYAELVAENARLREIVEQQRQTILRQEQVIAGLQQQLQALREQLEEVRRRQKRQAAPFSKGPPKPDPKRPGRKPGTDYGRQASRPDPTPEQITETYDASLPANCPHCGSDAVAATHTALQYQVELPQQPIYRRFQVQCGQCRQCRRRLQGRHPLQTSDALGAARSQLGPVLQAFLALAQKQLGLAYGKCTHLLQRVWNIRLTRGGVVQALQRLARRVAPAVEPIRQAIRASPEVAADETGWRIGGQSAWLHVQATDQAVCYVIDRSRASAVTAQVLGWDYAGVLVHDGLRTYDNFGRARHQQCQAHVLRRCRELQSDAPQRSAAVLRWIQEHLQEALAYRTWLDAEPQRLRTLALWEWCHRATLLQRLQRWRPRRLDLRRFRRFLQQRSGSLFTFLLHGSQATSWRAEQALRPAVVNRKVWGGNRTPLGALVQSTLMTVLGTLERQGHPLLETLSQTLRQGHLQLRLAS